MTDQKKSADGAQLMRMREVLAATTLCKASIYRLRQRGEFPNPVRLIGRTVAWRRADVERWLESRPETRRREC